MSDRLPERVFNPSLHRYAVLSKHIPQAAPDDRWADLGGGAGEFSILVRNQGYEVTLVDSDPRNLANVQRHGIEGIHADLNTPLDSFHNNQFAGVSLVEVIEHVPRAEQLATEALRILRPGGVLLLSTPNAVWWRERLRILFGRQLQAEGYHYRFFSVSGIKRLCEHAGFRLDHMEFSSPAFGLNWILRRVLRRAKRMHVRVPRVLARLFAQTTYLVASKE